MGDCRILPLIKRHQRAYKIQQVWVHENVWSWQAMRPNATRRQRRQRPTSIYTQSSHVLIHSWSFVSTQWFSRLIMCQNDSWYLYCGEQPTFAFFNGLIPLATAKTGHKSAILNWCPEYCASNTLEGDSIIEVISCTVCSCLVGSIVPITTLNLQIVAIRVGALDCYRKTSITSLVLCIGYKTSWYPTL